MTGPSSPSPTCLRRLGPTTWAAPWVALLVALALTPVTARAADRAVTLKTTFQGLKATATLGVPADWQGTATGSRVTFVAPSSRKGCDHVLKLRLGMLHVAPSVTAPDWVKGRLDGDGPIVAAGGADYSWGVAARKGRRTSVGAGALVAGTGRFGRIMAELRATTALTERCTDAQSAQATKRLIRVLQAVALQAAPRKR